jgi:hypothetical protein
LTVIEIVVVVSGGVAPGASSVAVIVYVVGGEVAVGVPVTAPVRESMISPSGRTGAMPLKVTVTPGSTAAKDVVPANGVLTVPTTLTLLASAGVSPVTASASGAETLTETARAISALMTAAIAADVGRRRP